RPFADTGLPRRRLVRRYHLTYDPNYHASLLQRFELEGRCSGTEDAAPAETANGQLDDAVSCPKLPPVTFDYQHVDPFTTTGSAGRKDLPGFEGFDERVRLFANSPDHSIDEALSDLFDINADGLPDLLVTAPFLYGGNHGVYFNGAGGVAGAF